MAKSRWISGVLAAAMLAGVAGTGVATAEPAAAQTKPVIYLSFDDGPTIDEDGVTLELLELLKRHDARATFFVLGDKANASPDTLRKIDAGGHALANHTRTHPALNALTAEEIRAELAYTHATVKAATNRDMKCFRPPWGKSYLGDSETVTNIRGIITTPNSIVNGVTYQLEDTWLDTGNSDPEVSVAGIVNYLRQATDGSVVLLHDGQSGRQNLLPALEQFLNSPEGRQFRYEPMPGCETAPPRPPAPAPTPFTGPIAQASGIDDILAASDYRAADADYLRLYHAFLARTPDIEGAKYWLSLAHGGLDLDAAAYNFSVADEFINKYGHLDNAEFVRVVYRNVLGRPEDAAGFAYWLGLVETGQTTRHGVVRWIAAGNEFIHAHPYAPTR